MTANRIVDKGNGRHVVALGGHLVSGWAGRLAAALAARSVSVIRGRAQRSGIAAWEVELEVQVLDARVDLAALDLVALTREEPQGARIGAPVVVRSTRVERTASDLEVEVRAPDAVGFLHAILRIFAFYSLFPREMVLETDGAEVRDVFRLQALAGAAPSPEVARAIEDRLRELARLGG